MVLKMAMLLCLGPVIEEDDSIKIGKVMNVNFSVDHKVDGAKGRKLLEVLRK